MVNWVKTIYEKVKSMKETQMFYIKTNSEVRLNLGCGRTPMPDFINVDCEPSQYTDFIWNLNNMPYPWKTSSISVVALHHILEHLDNPKAVMEEIWRICKDRARVSIKIPWYKRKSVLWNPEHKYDFAPEWFMAWDENRTHKRVYAAFKDGSEARFEYLGMRKIKERPRLIGWLPKIKRFKLAETEITLKVVK